MWVAAAIIKCKKQKLPELRLRCAARPGGRRSSETREANYIFIPALGCNLQPRPGSGKIGPGADCGVEQRSPVYTIFLAIFLYNIICLLAADNDSMTGKTWFPPERITPYQAGCWVLGAGCWVLGAWVTTVKLM